MHCCLTKNEILSMIFRGLLSPYTHEDNRQVLTTMALVCKTFYGPAMDESWHTVEDLSRFIHTFPSDVVVFEEDTNSEAPSTRNWSLCRLPTDEEWQPFDQHARRVRQLHWRTPLVGEVMQVDGLHLLAAMKSYYDYLPAFRTLLSLTLDVRSLATLPYWTLFFPGSLSSVVSVSGSWAARNEPASARLDFLCTLLFTTSRSVNELRFDPSVELDLADFRLLGEGFPNLRQLHTALVTDSRLRPDQEEASVSPRKALFPRLQDLQLSISATEEDAESPDCIQPDEVLSLISSSSLNHLDLKWKGGVPTEDGLRSLIAAVARFHGTLETCKISVRPQGLSAEDPPIQFRSVLPLFLALAKSLSVLDLSEVPLRLDMQSLTALIEACPKLHKLRLGQLHSGTTSTVPITALAVIRTQGSPVLEELGLPIAPLATAGLLPTYLPRAPQNALRIFEFGWHNDISRRVEAYDFAKTCFPRADVLWLCD